MTNPSENTFFLRPTAPDEVEDIIKTLNIGKSLRPNSIPTKLLKQFSRSISVSLLYLINLSFEDGVFSNALNRQGICSSHLTLCLNLNFIFGYYSRAYPDLKIIVYIFSGTC